MQKINRLLLIFLFSQAITACMPNIYPAGETISAGYLAEDLFVTPDGVKLPLKLWKPKEQEVKSVIVAIHGFNDYSQFFQQPGLYFSQHKILSYAYDQRGFGGSTSRGLWAGIETYLSDLACFVALIKNKHPEVPVYLLGESMGGALVISAVTKKTPILVDGIILLAPAVWARESMPWYQNTLLWTLSHTVPWMTLTGGGLNIKPSDNIEMLRALGRDPLVIKATRVETINGLTDLMDHAFYSANNISANTLLLYGEKDEVIPQQPMYQFLKKLVLAKQQPAPKIALYKNGYHMLLRDLQAATLWKDIKDWMSSTTASFASKADKRAQIVLNKSKVGAQP